MKKDYNNTRFLATNIIYQVMFNNGYSNLLLKNDLNHLSDQDKGLVTKIVYGSIQNFDLLKYQLTQLEYEKISNKQLVILVMSLYQMHFLDKIPNYAIVDEALKVAKMILNSYQSKFIYYLLKQLESLPLKYSNSKDEDLDLAINYSHPLWFIKMIKKQYGKDSLIKILKDNHQEAKIYLRYNPLSNSYDELINEYQLEPSDKLANAFIYHGKSIASFKPYLEGLVSVQDLSSQKVSLLLNPSLNSKVLDMCAAPGTKTTHLAQIMNNSGLIKAYDIYQHKIDLINQQAQRLNITNIEAYVHDATQLEGLEVAEYFDYILCDALCTGLGVIKRKPEIKYQDISQSMDYIIETQEKLLEQAYYLLKRGGVLVYSTCTINKKENEKQINKLLEKHSDLELIFSQNIFGFNEDADSFYLAKIIKN